MSALTATKQCQGGYNGRMCGHQWQMGWNTGLWDGTIGAGQQTSALEVTLGYMIRHRDSILRADNGGTSQSDPGAGTQSKSLDPLGRRYGPITTLDRVGGSFTTAISIGLLAAGIFWLLVNENRPREEDKNLTSGSYGPSAGPANFAQRSITAPIPVGKQAAEDTKDTMHQRPWRKLKFFWRFSGDPSIRSGEVMELDNLQAAHQSIESSEAHFRMNGAGPGPHTRVRICGWDWLKRGRVLNYNTCSGACYL